MVELTAPINANSLLSLKIGQEVLVSGIIYTARDRLHRFLVHEISDKKEMPFNLHEGILYHCGPVVKAIGDSQVVIAAGPTTSSRMDLYEPEVIKGFQVRAIIGKGGMGDETLKTMQECGCVYLNTINGAAVYLAEKVKRVVGVWRLDEFGEAEALWALEVEHFPAVVTMDAHGNSLHKYIRDKSMQNLKGIL